MQRRRFLELCALAPALPLAAKLPAPVWNIDWSDISIADGYFGQTPLSRVTCYNPEYIAALEKIVRSKPDFLDNFKSAFFGVPTSSRNSGSRIAGPSSPADTAA